MEYRINSFIDIQPLPSGKSVVSNKKNGQTFELGKKETSVLMLLDGTKTPNEISLMCDFFTTSEIVALENQFLELDIIGNSNSKHRINLIKIKFPIFSANKIFPSNKLITKIVYYIFMIFSILFFLIGFSISIFNVINGINVNNQMNIKSLSSFENFEIFDLIYSVVFFSFAIVFHEFGHMIVARKNNLSVPDAGIMLYLLIPCAYTNLTFLNYCKNKSLKLRIFFAGILSDLGLLGLAVTIFNFSPTNVLAKYSLISALLCIISILGNIVVTFKFDGYYILQTLLETDNLQKNSVAIVLAYIKMIFSKIINSNKKISLQQLENTDSNMEFTFSIIYVFLTIIYVPIIILNGLIVFIIQIGGNLL